MPDTDVWAIDLYLRPWFGPHSSSLLTLSRSRRDQEEGGGDGHSIKPRRDQEEGGELDSHEEFDNHLRAQARSRGGRRCRTLKRAQERSRGGR